MKNNKNNLNKQNNLNNQNKNTKAQKKGMEVAKEFISNDSLKFDPNGSYTGKTENKYEEPVQDADDL